LILANNAPGDGVSRWSVRDVALYRITAKVAPRPK
jgi:hypothetical protein